MIVGVDIEVLPLVPERWNDLVELFELPGGSIVRGCWCMYYRQTAAESSRTSRDTRKQAMRALVEEGQVPGLIAYIEGRPAGWISLGPREVYPRLARSPVMKPVDERPVWSIVCFYVEPKSRGKGVAGALLAAATEFARSRGATLLEAYPVDKLERSHPDFMWFGGKSLFDRAGFEEVARRKPTRPVMRRQLSQEAP